MVGLLGAAAVLLIAAGIAKLVDPARTGRAIGSLRIARSATLERAFVIRLMASAEIVVGLGEIVVGGRIAAALLALSYLVLAVVSMRMRLAAPDADCGCFGGATGNPISHWHTAVNVAFAVAALIATARPVSSVIAEVGHQPMFGIPFVLGVGLLTWLCFLLMTALPVLLQARATLTSTR